jgi:DnaJ-class molecular chaperone
MKTFEQERLEYIKRFGLEPPKCQSCKGRGTLEGWNYNKEMETNNICEFCDGNGYHTIKTSEAIAKT